MARDEGVASVKEFNELSASALDTSRAVMARQRLAELELKRAKQALDELSVNQARSLALIEATLNASPDAIVALDLNGQIKAGNRNFALTWNLPESLLASRDAARIWAHCAGQVVDPAAFYAGITQGGDTFPDEIVFKDGRTFEQHVCPQRVHDQPSGVVVQWRDITRRRAAQAQSFRMSRMLEHSHNEIYLFDRHTLRFSYANAGARDNLGYDQAVLLTMTPLDLTPEFDEHRFRSLLAPLLKRECDQLIFETVHQRADGSRYDVQVHLELDTDHDQPQFMALILDITERKQSQDLIWRQANFDQLTQLPNRAMLQDRLVQEIGKARRDDCRLALLFIDLDKFKEVNDILGHEQGDALLVQAAHRIQASVRETDTVARMGGDEFVVLLTQIHDPVVISDVAQALVNSLARPFNVEGTEVVVTGSVGIAMYPEDATDTDSLMKCADQAMYGSKNRGRNQFGFFTPEIEVRSKRRMRVLGHLRSALKAGEIYLNFQPIVDLRTGMIHKAEALIRWSSPELGLVPPVEFIPLAEESGLIVELGDWVLEEAARWVSHWRTKLHIEVQVSVNKSPAQFVREKDGLSVWLGKLKALGLSGNAIAMEITEGMLMEASDEVRTMLGAYRSAGIEIAIDDFGTGYSSLSYLRLFEIDYLKIDRSFVARLAPSSKDLVLAQAIITMAHALGLKVVAEGVETRGQLELLSASGCDLAQGYYLYHPMLANEFEAVLQRQTSGAA